MTEITSDPSPEFLLPEPEAGSEIAAPLLALAAALDARLTSPVLVLAPVAPATRKLVLAGSRSEIDALAQWLATEGFVQRGPVWARFDVDGARAVQLQQLAGSDLDAALSDASPMGDARHLRRPGRAVVARLQAAAARDTRRASVRRAGTARVSISGPDGSGKSTQLAQLRAMLASVGTPVAVAWAPTITRKRSYSRRRTTEQLPTDGSPITVRRSARRRRFRLMEHGWATAITVRNAAEMWRHVVQAPRGHVLLVDRFSLDAEVKLQYWYGHRRGLNLGFERRLFRAIAPRADVAVLLVVPAERNRARRPQDWTSEQLAVFWRLYPEIAGTLGAVVIDGDRAIPEVASDVVRAVWRLLP
jgi:thymidylate kinase